MANGYVASSARDALELDYAYGATLGRVAGASRMAVYGHRTTPVAGDDVWEGGGAYPLQAASTKLEILSASANDTAAGTGARTFVINGLDTNFNMISETITMNGVTPVQSANSYLRVNGLTIASSGSGLVNAGDVTLRVTGAGATQAIARAGYGFAKQCVFTVPAGFTLLVTDVLPECGGVNTATAIVMAFTRILPNGSIVRTNEYNASTTLLSQRSVITGAVVSAMSTVSLRVSSVVGTPVDGYASINGLLIDNTQLV